MAKKTILLTGCAGFIGSNFVKKICLLPEVKAQYDFLILDALTYAGRYENIEQEINSHDHLSFTKIDLRDNDKVAELFNTQVFDGVIHFAAESHVDNSIKNPNIFVETNVLGTLNLLNGVRKLQGDGHNPRFLHISTDEVYGSLKEDDPAFTENHPIDPNSPYSASKASSDLLVNAYHETFKIDTVMTRCSNNYGPFQNEEKLIPLMITKAKSGESLPVYGTGKNIRDWIFVDDHNLGVWDVYLKGKSGEAYNLGGGCEKRNLDVVKEILSLLNRDENLITFVEDRKGHDWRYAMDYSKAEKELGWTPKVTFEEGMRLTIDWYLSR